LAELVQLRRQIARVVAKDAECRRRARELRIATERLRVFVRLVESSPDLISVVDRDLVYWMVNPTYTRMHGKSREGIEGHPVAQIHLPQEYESLIRPSLERCFAGETVQYEGWITYAVAGMRYVDVHYYPLIEGGRVEYAVVLIHDITEMKRGEEALRASEERYRALVETTSDWVWETDENGVYSYVSPRVRDLLGYSPEEVLGKTPFDLMPPEEARRVSRIFGETVAQRQPIKSLVNTNLAKDGRPVVLETSGVPFFDAEGRLRGYRGVDRDITEWKEAESFREEYLSLVSHDLRAPLTAIMGQAGWLERTLEAQGNQREAASAQAIVKGAKRMNTMIQELMESARLETGRMEIRKRPTDLLGLIRDLLDRVGTLEDRSRLRLEAAEALPEVPLDPDRIERALVNLLTNALKYSPPDKQVVVRVGRLPDMALVSVIDQGPGIPPEELPHLFQRFYRAKVGQQTEGLGLGLYITRLIVEAHDGRIWVESEVGKGSTFSFALPLE